MNYKLKIVAAVVAGLGAVSAQAGIFTATAVKTYAVENFGAATVSVALPVVSYQVAQPITGTVAQPNTFFIDFTLNGGALWSDNTATPATPTALTAPTVFLKNGTGLQDVKGTFSSASADGATLRYSFTINNNAVYAAGISVFTLGAPSSDVAPVAGDEIFGYARAVNTLLGADGGACGTAANNQVTMTSKMYDSSGLNQVDTVGTYVETAIVARSARGITGAVLSSANYAPPEVAAIDVSLTPTSNGTNFDRAGTPAVQSINLGSVKFTDGTAVTLAGTAYTLASLAANHLSTTVVVNGDFSALYNNTNTKTGDVWLQSGVGACAATLPGAPALGSATAVINASKTSATITTATAGPGTPISGTSYSVCMATAGTPATATSVAINPSQYTGYGTVNKTVASAQLAEYASGAACLVNLYKTDYNGAVVTVRNYNPASTAAFGWGQFTRVINTGNNPAALKGFFINADGTTSTSTSLGGATIPAGGSRTMTNTAIEAALGAPNAAANATSNARLRIIGTTGSMRVQNYHVQPSGALYEASGAQSEAVSVSSPAAQQGTQQ